MAALIETIGPRSRRVAVGDINSFDAWVGLWGLDGLGSILETTVPRQQEIIDPTFVGHVVGAYLRNAVVFACLAVRARLFSEARFQFQQMRGGRPGNLFGTPALSVLERPEPGKSTRDLLQVAMLDADIGGNGFLLGRQAAIRRLRPDWMTIAYGSRGRATELGSWDPDAEVIGYGYHPGGFSSGEQVITFVPEEIAHFAPTKDPLARNRGVSILTAGVREIMADNGATTSKLSFFENAATPNIALKFPATMSKDKALEWIEIFEQEHRGARNAARTVYLGAGVEPFPVGLNFQEMDFAKVQGKAETRIAALTGMHPVVVALSEGLAGSSLNSGNFGSAARLVGDATLRPLWGDISSSLESIIPPLPGTRLWFDDRDIAFLREDVGDQADIIQKQGATIGQAIRDGFTPASAIDAVVSGDMTRLVHTGLVSVQLQQPGAAPPAAYRAKRDFWSVEPALDELGTVRSGEVLTDVAGSDGRWVHHPLVSAYPSLFDVAEVSVPETSIVSRDAIVRRRAALLGDGKPAGYLSLARSLGVSVSTVRRRLAEQPTTA
jgi:phage portal protein BeeE